MSGGDTAREAEQVYIATLRRMSPEARLAQAFGLVALTRVLVERGIATRHPDYSPDEVSLAASRISLGDDLFRRVYPRAGRVSP